MSLGIAIVGRGVTLPGALDLERFAQVVLDGVDLVSSAPPGALGVPDDALLGDGPDRATTLRGGYVQGFEEVWDPGAFQTSSAELAGLDPLTLWLAHAARQALAEVRLAPGDRALDQAGAVFGNLGFPTPGQNRFGEQVILAGAGRAQWPPADARNHAMSGLPAALLRRALGLGLPAFCLDAACASSLYALALACKRLRDGRADLMLAGAVNRADQLFLHLGFSAINALSRTGQTRPFHSDADGLLPAEGAAVFALMRVEDALHHGLRVFGVIDGVGLSNDGRARNLLAPSSEGQVRAIQAALHQAGWSPTQLGLIECHATGTPVGDRTELASMIQAYGDMPTGGLPIGSFKSQVGHLITVAGSAGLLKVLTAFETELLPATLHVEAPLRELDGSPFHLLHEPLSWAARDKYAAVSAFGFGGNNGHLLVRTPESPACVALSVPEAAPRSVGVVGAAAILGEAFGVAPSLALLRRLPDAGARLTEFEIELDGLRFPPNDLGLALAQQSLVLQAARDATAGLDLGDRSRIGVYVGMATDGEITRWALRPRITQLTGEQGLADRVVSALRAENVVGTMPNIPANRINVHVDAAALGFTVSAEGLSGLVALELAWRAIRDGEIDVAVVGAVDLGVEPRQIAARAALGDTRPPIDGAVVLVLAASHAPDVASIDEVVLCIGSGGVTPRASGATGGLFEVLDLIFGEQSADVSSTPGPLPSSRREHSLAGTDAMEAQVRVSGVPATPPSLAPRTRPLRLQAHPPTITLPPAPAMPSAPSVAVAPALLPPPELPAARSAPTMPLSREFPAGAARAVPLPTEPEAAAEPEESSLPPAPPHRPSPAPVSAGTDADTILALLAEQQAQLTRVHSQFLTQQAEVQRRFVGAMASRWRGLLGADEALSASVAPLPPSALPDPAPQPHFPALPAPPSGPALPRMAPAPSLATSAVPTPAFAPPAVAALTPPPGARTATSSPTAAPRPSTAGPVAAAAAPPTPTTAFTTPAGAPPRATAAPASGPAPARPAPADSFGYRPDGLPRPGTPASGLPGPKFDRAALESLASASVPAVLGDALAPLDAWARVVRMPEPPLLLADRVTGIQGPIATLGRGTIWTETDVTEDKWFLHDRRMPGGIMIESGQADLLLASWQGIDLKLQGERVYRLLGCDLRYERSLPRVGETLAYRIDIDGHAQLGGVRMFFFHYDCFVGDEPQITVRQGQAGFFTDAELAASGGILWDPAEAPPALDGPMDEPPLACEKASFAREELESLAAGNVREVLGAAFSLADTHTLTPSIPSGKLILVDRVTELSRTGGPWKRGYLRAELDINPEQWFFEGHFKNDPCMPGTLMLDGCLGLMYLYLQTLGVTVGRDGWRFEPAKKETFKLRCRGQVIPTSGRLVYEVFVQSFEAGPVPRLRAQILCTVDGLKCFHADPLTVELVPDWPLDRMPPEEVGFTTPNAGPPPFDYRSLLACAWGRPSEAFGPMYKDYDGVRRVPRLPGPPYHFMSRVPRTDGVMGTQKAGSTAWVEYDVPPDAWYFAETGGTMPWAVLLETALQPCGWLASWSGNGLHPTMDLLFRNLDGKVTVHCDVLPDIGTLVTRTHLKAVNRSGGMVIVAFDVKMTALRPDGDLPVLDMETVFGFFPPQAFANQVGLPPTEEERAALEAPSDFLLDLVPEPPRFFAGAPRLPVGRLRVIDRITGYWPTGGQAGLGKLRAEKDVVSYDWFFKAHFYQDPVQPGSLGLEAIVQLLQAWCIENGIGADVPHPRFEPILTGAPFEWRYRGQVVPKNKLIRSEVEILSISDDRRSVLADGWLWVDDKRIYRSTRFGVRVVSAPPPEPAQKKSRRSIEVAPPVDHAPTYVLPSMPMTGLLMLALLGTGGSGLRDASALRWLVFPDGPRQVDVDTEGGRVTLSADGQAVFVATDDPPGAAPPVPELRDGVPGPSGATLYTSGELFHGPAFHVVERIEARGSNGATLWLKPGFPPEVVLDGATHGLRHDRLEELFPELNAGQVGYPARVHHLWLYGAPPAGGLRCELRTDGVRKGRPQLVAWYFDAEGRLVAWMCWEEVLLPAGPLGTAEPLARRRFLLGEPSPGVALTTLRGEEGELEAGAVRLYDWLPGSVKRVYGTDTPIHLAIKEVEASLRGVHPRALVVEANRVYDPVRPVYRRAYTVTPAGSTIRVHAGPADRAAQLQWVADWWSTRVGEGPWATWLTTMSAYFDQIELEDPVAFGSVRGRPALYLANHETYLESVAFTSLISAITEFPVRALAKTEHGEGWLGGLHDLIVKWPGARHPGSIVYFHQQNPGELTGLLRRECEDAGLLVHVEGSRQVRPGQPVEKISSIWVDTASERGLPIVPVAFRGGIGDGEKHDVPQGSARQTAWVGTPIWPDTLKALPYAERRRFVADAINRLGVPAAPAAPQPELEAEVQRHTPLLGRPRAAIRAALEACGAFEDARTGRDPAGLEAWGAALRRYLGLEDVR